MTDYIDTYFYRTHNTRLADWLKAHFQSWNNRVCCNVVSETKGADTYFYIRRFANYDGAIETADMMRMEARQYALGCAAGIELTFQHNAEH